jgi:hypothetical protein
VRRPELAELQHVGTNNVVRAGPDAGGRLRGSCAYTCRYARTVAGGGAVHRLLPRTLAPSSLRGRKIIRVHGYQVGASRNPDRSHVEPHLVAVFCPALLFAREVLLQEVTGALKRSDVGAGAPVRERHNDIVVVREDVQSWTVGSGRGSSAAVPSRRNPETTQVFQVAVHRQAFLEELLYSRMLHASNGDCSHPSGAISASTSAPANPCGNSRSKNLQLTIRETLVLPLIHPFLRFPSSGAGRQHRCNQIGRRSALADRGSRPGFVNVRQCWLVPDDRGVVN